MQNIYFCVDILFSMWYSGVSAINALVEIVDKNVFINGINVFYTNESKDIFKKLFLVCLHTL